jgi:hypothetical protein
VCALRLEPRAACQVAQGLLWVWADPGSPETAAATSPALTEQWGSPDWTLLVRVCVWGVWMSGCSSSWCGWSCQVRVHVTTRARSKAASLTHPDTRPLHAAVSPHARTHALRRGASGLLVTLSMILTPCWRTCWIHPTSRCVILRVWGRCG